MFLKWCLKQKSISQPLMQRKTYHVISEHGVLTGLLCDISMKVNEIQKAKENKTLRICTWSVCCLCMLCVTDQEAISYTNLCGFCKSLARSVLRPVTLAHSALTARASRSLLRSLERSLYQRLLYVIPVIDEFVCSCLF